MRQKLFLSFVLLLSLIGCGENDADPVLTLSEKSVQVSADGAVFDLVVTSTVTYTVNNSETWVKLLDMTKDGDKTTFKMEVEKNLTEIEKSARITFIGKGVTPQAFKITQAAKEPVGITPSAIEVAFDATTTKFSVIGKNAWTASSSDPAYVLSATSGRGATEVEVTFPANSGVVDKVVTITVTVGEEPYTVTITHKALNVIGILSDWDIAGLRTSTEATWIDNDNQTTLGANDKYVAPSTGMGKLEFYNGEGKDAVSVATGAATAQRLLGGESKGSDIYVNGLWFNDYWLITANSKVTLPAGTKISFYLPFGTGKQTSKRWMLEILEGSEYKPLIPTASYTDTAVKTSTGVAVEYSETVTANVEITSTGASMGYTQVSGEYTLQTATDKLQIRWRPVGYVTISGTKVDQISASTASRFTSRRYNESDKAVYDCHITLSVVSLGN